MNYNFSSYSLPIISVRDTYVGQLLINDADKEQNTFYIEIKRTKHGKIPDEKRKKIKNIRLIFNGSEKYS